MGAAALLNPITAIGAGIAGAGAAFVKAARSAEDFNRAMRNSQAIMGELSEALDKDMRRAAFDVARFTQFSASEAAKAYFYLASAGLDATQSIKAMPVVSKFAQAGMFDLAQATDLLTDAQSALGLTVDDSTQNMKNMLRVSDVLVKANTLANASVQQFSESLTNKAGAAMKVVGMDIEEGVAVLAAFADQGLKGAEAGTAFSIVLRELQKRAIDNRDAFKHFGVATFDVNGEVRPMVEIIGDLERALAGASDETKKMTLAQLGFQEKSIAYLQTILGTSQAIGEYTENLRKAAKTTEEVANKQLTPFQKGWAELSGNIGAVTQALGVVTDALGGLMTATAKGQQWYFDRPKAIWETLVRSGTVVAEGLRRFTDDLKFIAYKPLSELNTELRESLQVGERLEQELADRTAKMKELADATGDVTEATKRATDSGQWKDVAEIIGALSRELAAYGKTSGELALGRLEDLGASPNAMRLARDTVEALESRQAAKELDDIIYGLEREQQALAHTTRELDLLEAGWRGATEAQLANAMREQVKLERQAKADAARHTKAADRITRFVEVDVSRMALSGMRGGRGRKQKTEDEKTHVLLERVETAVKTQRNAYAMVGP
jgi:TP901 family phage tail tape measure protein